MVQELVYSLTSSFSKRLSSLSSLLYSLSSSFSKILSSLSSLLCSFSSVPTPLTNSRIRSLPKSVNGATSKLVTNLHLRLQQRLEGGPAGF